MKESGPSQGLLLWDAKNHISRTIRDLRVDVFSEATGRVRLIFEHHAICLLESDAEGTVSIDGTNPACVTYGAHTLLFIPKGVVVSGEPVSPIEITLIQIPQHWFDRAMHAAGIESCDYRYFETESTPVLAQAAALFKSIALEAPMIALPPLIDALINSITTRILRILCRAPEMPFPAKTEPITQRELSVIEDFVNKNIGRSIRATELANLLDMSASSFCRAFKATTRETPMRYVLRRRIEDAKSQLRDPRRSLVDVALHCGFSSQSHFTTMFRRLTGMTPARYRETIRNGLKSLLCALATKFAMATNSAASAKYLVPAVLYLVT
jgi:AraC family transcriptional regulator